MRIIIWVTVHLLDYINLYLSIYSSDYSHDKTSRDNALSALRATVLNQLRDTNVEVSVLSDTFTDNLQQIFRDCIFDGTRCDGRDECQLRDISCEVGVIFNFIFLSRS